jgi:hypothetical protein
MSMTVSLITPVIAFWGLAQIELDASSADGRVPMGLFALLLFSLVLFVALTVVFVWLARVERPGTSTRSDLVVTRRVPSSRAHVRRRRRPFVPRKWGLDRGIDPAAAAGESGRHPPPP